MSTQIADPKKKAQLQTFLVANRAQIEAALPATARRYLPPEKVIKVVLLAASKSPKLLACEQTTILRSVMDLVQLGLEPGGLLGHGHLVPFRNNKANRMECQAIVGFQGYIDLAWRSGRIAGINAQIIYSGDSYDIDFGSDARVVHKPKLDGDRGDPVAVYCVAKFVDGGQHIEVMTVSDVDKIRKQSRAKDAGPWHTHWEEMAKKTVIRRARKYWPQCVELATAAAIDDQADSGEAQIVPTFDGVLEPEEPEKPKTQQVLDKVKNGSKAATANGEFDYGPPPMEEEAQ